MATGLAFGWQVESANGTPVSGAKVYFYAPGTTTPRTTYTDQALTVPAANPVVADSAGWFLTYISSELAYDVVIKSADDSITYQERKIASNISGAQPADATLTAIAGLAVGAGDYIEATGVDTFRARKLQVATYAALTAIPAASRFDDMVVYVASRATDGDGGEGNWRFDAASSATANGGTILAPDVGTGRWVRIYTSDINPQWFGAVADWDNGAQTGTDSTAAFVASLLTGENVDVPPGSYRLTDPIALTAFAQRLRGAGKVSTTLVIDHVNGAGVTMAAAQQKVEDIRIIASDARQSAETGDPYDLEAGQFGLSIYNASATTTQCEISRVLVDRHPNHGIYMGGPGLNTIFTQCESYYNRGHGYAFDDRTIGGGSAVRCGIVDMISCRALDNGGNAVNVSQAGTTCYRFYIRNLETLWNAWNTQIGSLENYEVYLGGQNHVIEVSAVGDLDGDTRTVMANGDPRLAKASLSGGIRIRGSATDIHLFNNRYISVSRGVFVGTSCGPIKVIGGLFEPQELSGGPSPVSEGVFISSGSTDVEVDLASSDDVTTMVNDSAVTNWPAVVRRSLGSNYNITATAAFENFISEASVPIGKGWYRATLTTTIINGTSTNIAYSTRIVLTNSLAADTVLTPGAYGHIPVASHAMTMTTSFLFEVTAADDYTVKAQVRQSSGNLGLVAATNNTFGATYLMIERVR